MVVDDDADVRCAVVEFLSREGISSLPAVDGLDALERIQSGRPPCAIVLDVDMPRLSGPALVATLRADSRLPRIPVVTMTAGNEPLGLDTEGHLPKPFARESLLAILFRICRSCGECDGAGPVVGSLFAARRRAELVVQRGSVGATPR
jgi:CheY-like chemotaxis protein